MKKTFIFFLMIIICRMSLTAEELLSFRNYNVHLGLSDNFIQNILRDHNGFMWFATLNGLNRYDGYKFKHYTLSENGTFNNDIRSIKDDADGNIWIEGARGWFFYNQSKDLIDENIFTILEKYGIDKKPEYISIDEQRNLWCVSESILYYYDFSRKNLRKIILTKEKKVIAIVGRGIYNILLYSDGEIVSIDNENGNTRPETHLSLNADENNRMYIDAANRLWLYTIHKTGLRCYDLVHKRYLTYQGEQILAENLITSVTNDNNGNIWVGTDNHGIYIIHSTGEMPEHIEKNTTDEFSLPDNHINSLYWDNNQTMWIGTAKQGVAFTQPGKTSITIYSLPDKEDIKYIQEDNKGNLWFCFDGEGINRLNTHNNTVTNFRKSQGTIPSDLVICAYPDSRGRVWFGTFGGGVFYEENGHFHIPQIANCSKSSNPLNQVKKIIEDKNGTLWFATFHNGLYALNSDLSLDEYTRLNSNLLTGSVMDLAYDNGNTLYIGTSSGLYKIDINKRELSSIKGSGTEMYKLPNYTTCLYYDSRGLLWVGTRNGLAVFYGNGTLHYILTTENGLSHNCIRSLTEDHFGTIWAATDHGINSISITPSANQNDTTRYTCFPYLEQDGIGNTTFNTRSMTCTSKGDILIGCLGKYLKIVPKPDKNNPNSMKHHVVFTNFLLQGHEIKPNIPYSDGRVLLKNNIYLTDKISLKHTDSNFTLEVSSMDYANIHRHKYVYRLKDNENWIPVENNQITFNKLSPGEYKLQVKIHDNKNTENNPVSYMYLTITPPLWKSGTAYFLYIMTFMIIIYITIIYSKKRHERILAKQRHEMEVSRQHEMYEAKLRFFTNVSHDLRTPLALIITPLERLMSMPITQNLQKELGLIHRHALILLNEVNQLLDFRRLDNQKTSLEASYSDLTILIKEVFDSFTELSIKKDIKMTLDLKCNSMNMLFDKNKMLRILMNLVSNAIKYNHKGGEIVISLEKCSSENEDTACIKIADTGIGIKDENKNKVFELFFKENHSNEVYTGSGIGLYIVWEYVKLHNGNIHVENNKPQGSVFTINLPIITENAKDSDIIENAVLDSNTSRNNEDNTKCFPGKMQPANSPNSQITILIVEDNDDFRNFLSDCLPKQYKTICANNGQNALDLLATSDVQIIISDVMMPIMDGLELCHRIKTDIRYSHIPIILLTARTAENHVIEGLKEGADDYITKPFNIEILQMRIKKLLEWSNNSHEKFRTIDISPSEITVSKMDEQLIEKAIRIVEDNFDNNEFSVTELSEQLNMSRSNLYKKLQAITGKPPLEFIRIVRLKRGKQLLEKTDLPISQIAYQIGLSPKLFAKYFKEEFGTLPSIYRNK